MVIKKALFLNTVYNNSPLNEIVHEKQQEIICFSPEAASNLTRGKIDFHYIDEFIPENQFEAMEKLARVYPEDWEKKIRKTLTYRKVPVGQVFSRELSLHFRDIIKSYHAAVGVLDRYSPKQVICSPPIEIGSWVAVDVVPVYTHLPYILEEVCKARGIDFKTIEGVDNRQFYEPRRDNRFLFDMAVKGRNSSKWIINKISRSSKNKRKRILSVILKQGMYDTIRKYGDSKNVDVISYYQASDLFKITTPSDIEPAISKISKAWENYYSSDEFMAGLPDELSVVKNICKKEIDYYLASSLRSVMQEVARFEEVLDSLEIDLVLSLEDFKSLGKARAAKAEAMDIPLVIVQHGIFSRKFHIQYSYPRGRYNFVWGPAYIETFVNDGFPKERVLVTGTTSLDIIYSKSKGKDQVTELFSKLGIPLSTKKVLWTNTPMHIGLVSRSLKKYISEIEEFFGMMKKRKETLIVKPHMNESPDIYRVIAEYMDFEPVIVTKYLPQLISGSDAVVVSNSTVGLQAMIAKKPVILYTTQQEGDFLEYVKSGAAEAAFSIKDLDQALDKVLYTKGYISSKAEAVRSYLEEFAAKPDGSGMTKVIDMALDIIGKKKK